MVRQLFLRSGLYFTGLVLVKLLSTFLFIFLARYLQPELFGKLTYFMTLLSLLTLVSDWGLIQWFQVHHTVDNENTLIPQIAQARVVGIVISGVLFFTYAMLARVFNFYETTLFLVLLIPEAMTSVTDGYYLVHHRTVVIAFKQLSKYLFPVLLILFSRHRFSLETILISFLLSSVVTMLWYVPSPYYRFGTFTWSKVKSTLKQSSTYATLLLTSAFYSRGDALVLESRLGNAALGLYSAGYRYLDAMSLFPSAVAQNLFHISAQHNVITTQKVLSMTAVMGGMGIVLGGALLLGSHILTVGILGEAYASTEIIVKIFGIVTAVLFLNSPLSTIVQSSTLVKRFLPWGIANTVLNVGLNILIVPIAGGVGAAMVMLLTEITGLCINIYFVKQRLNLSEA